MGALVIATGGFGLVAAGGVAAFVLGSAAGAITLGAGLAAVEATSRRDAENGTESSLGDYVINSLTASATVGGSIIALLLAPHAALQLASMATPILGIQYGIGALGVWEFATGTVTIANLAFQLNDVTMFYQGEKDLREPTGNATYDELKTISEWGAASYVANKGGRDSVYIPRDADGNPIPLNKQRVNGQDIPLPDPAAEGRPHTVLGGKVSSETGEVYRQSATFPGGTWPTANGYDVPWSEVHWTDHGMPQHHANPHQHIFEYNPDKGGWIRKGPTEFEP